MAVASHEREADRNREKGGKKGGFRFILDTDGPNRCLSLLAFLFGRFLLPFCFFRRHCDLKLTIWTNSYLKFPVDTDFWHLWRIAFKQRLNGKTKGFLSIFF